MPKLILLFKFFSRREFLVFGVAFAIFVVALSFFAVKLIEQNTEMAMVFGGEYAEGVVGQPSFINPILAFSDVDRDLVELTFSDLNDLAESYKIDESGKVWRYRLKENLFWHDNEKITADDIIFSVQTVLNTDVYSPLVKNWQGILVSRISEREVEFVLPGSYVFFKNTLEDFRPIPKHIFGDIPAANFKLSDNNLQPIGSGPYAFDSFQKESSGYVNLYRLKAFENSPKKPYIKGISFAFYRDELELINAFNSGSVDGFLSANQKNLSKINFSYQTAVFRMLKYYAVFLNPHSHSALKDKNVRLALSLATDKRKIIEKIFNNQASAVNGPLLLSDKDEEKFSIEEANSVLEKTGWRWNHEENIREKEDGKELIKLEFALTVPEIDFLIETANAIQQDWAKIGVKLNLSIVSTAKINEEIIKSRNYQMILFGNILGHSQDLFSFWHSSERFYPGLNLALYENKTADKLIETIRQNFNDEKRQAELNSLQSLIIMDLPAIFLYSPNYLYVSDKKLFGVEGDLIAFISDRFKGVEKWYVKTVRVFK